MNFHIISILGGKGGVGKSVFTANLALAFMKELKTRVLLIDLDAESCGDQNVILGLKPLKTMSEIASFTGQINPTTVSTLVTKHSSGLGFIGAVKSAMEKLSVQPELMEKPLSALGQIFPYIIVDLGCHIGDLQMKVLEKSSAVIVVSTPEVLAANQSLKLMNQLIASTLPTDLFQIALNKFGPGALSPQALAQTFKKNIIGIIPQDDTASSTALQSGNPVVLAQPQSAIAQAYHELTRKLTSNNFLNRLQQMHRPTGIKSPQAITAAPASVNSGGGNTQPDRKNSPRNLFKEQIHRELINTMNLKKGITETKGDVEKERQLFAKTQQTISQLVDKMQPGMSRDDRSQIIKEVLDEALGLGPLETLLAEDSVTEIMVNGADRIFVERAGKISLSPVTFTSNVHLRNVIERIVTPLGRRIDEKTPYVDARLKDGSRVNAVIEPIAIDGPSLTIRKFAKKPIVAENYVQWGSMTEPMIDFMRICVENGLNVIISGGTGSGKTTLLNVMSSFIPSTERIVTVEDAAELQLKQEHVVRLETRPANMEGTGSITIRDLVRNSLRMRPDRIVVGECRGGEALDMLSAMNTGHDGSMTTVHANSPREAIGRLETLCMMAGMDLPAKAIREQIAGAVDLIVQISRLSDGSRKVISITEVAGMQGETVTLQEIFKYKEEGFDKNRKILGQFLATGLIPTFIEEFERKGLKIPRTLFSNEAAFKKVPGGKP
ncbi:MAG: ATPase, T2SS/T4P/T4SS family [Bdellovibrionota bacterium]